MLSGPRRRWSDPATGVLGVLLLLVAGCDDLRVANHYAAFEVAEVAARVETEPVRNRGDAADDAAIWVDEGDPSRSTVIGTDKTDDGALAVYDLDGTELHRYPDGAPNNVDLRLGVPLGDREVDLAVASDRRADTIRVYAVDPSTRGLVNLAGERIRLGFAPYGLCMQVDEDGRTFVFVTSDDDGLVEQWLLQASDSGEVQARRVRTITLSSKAEGCVVDDSAGTLYVTEEDVGLWAFDASPDAPPSGDLLATVMPTEGAELVADVEGVAIHASPGGRRHLLVSSQGSSDFVVYRLAPFGYAGRFRIVDGVVDGVDSTDGIAVTGAELAPHFPGGLLVAQDDTNTGAEQNFKLVAWDEIAGALELPTASGGTTPPPPQ
jgi:3-phytase